jgi:TetR/AcrR family transcriptional regulator, transcriptional repressor for nem operon
VEIASRVFRSQGIEATGVAEIMAAAGLTHGGFYRHFDSKEELVAEAVALSLEQWVIESERAAHQGPRAALDHALEYMSPQNRDDLEHSCTFAASGSELVRADDKTCRIRGLQAHPGWPRAVHVNASQQRSRRSCDQCADQHDRRVDHGPHGR